MKTKQLFVAAAVAMTALFSCQKNEAVTEPTDSGEKMDVVLRIGGTNTQSKAIQDALGANATPTLSNGIIFFYDAADGYIWKRDVINAAEITTAPGQMFSGISSKATDVYIIGNPPTGLKAETDALNTIDKVKANLVDRNTQDVIADTVLLANILKSSKADFDGKITEDANGDWIAKVLLAPVVSRMQLSDIKTEDPLISSFEVAGVYIDNFHAGVAPTTDKATMTAPLTVGEDGTKLGTLSNQPYDEKTVAATGKKVSASDFGAGSVFAYHVAPTGTIPSGEDYVPAIIIKLTNINYTDAAGNPATMAEGYITVTKYVDATGEIKSFAPGTLYNIAPDQFVFDLSDITDNPNQPDVELTVFAEVCPWEIVNVTPDL